MCVWEHPPQFLSDWLCSTVSKLWFSQKFCSTLDFFPFRPSCVWPTTSDNWIIELVYWTWYLCLISTFCILVHIFQPPFHPFQLTVTLLLNCIGLFLKKPCAKFINAESISCVCCLIKHFSDISYQSYACWKVGVINTIFTFRVCQDISPKRECVCKKSNSISGKNMMFLQKMEWTFAYIL